MSGDKNNSNVKPETLTIIARMEWIERKLPKVSPLIQQSVSGYLVDLMSLDNIDDLSQNEASFWITKCRKQHDIICNYMDNKNIKYESSLILS